MEKKELAEKSMRIAKLIRSNVLSWDEVQDAAMDCVRHGMLKHAQYAHDAEAYMFTSIRNRVCVLEKERERRDRAEKGAQKALARYTGEIEHKRAARNVLVELAENRGLSTFQLDSAIAVVNGTAKQTAAEHGVCYEAVRKAGHRAISILQSKE